MTLGSVLARPPAAARPVRWLLLSDQLEPTLELLRQSEWPDFGSIEELSGIVDGCSRVVTCSLCRSERDLLSALAAIHAFASYSVIRLPQRQVLPAELAGAAEATFSDAC